MPEDFHYKVSDPAKQRGDSLHQEVRLQVRILIRPCAVRVCLRISSPSLYSYLLQSLFIPDSYLIMYRYPNHRCLNNGRYLYSTEGRSTLCFCFRSASRRRENLKLDSPGRFTTPPLPTRRNFISLRPYCNRWILHQVVEVVCSYVYVVSG